MWNISGKHYQKMKICTVETDLQTTEWGAIWYCYLTPSLVTSTGYSEQLMRKMENVMITRSNSVHFRGTMQRLPCKPATTYNWLSSKPGFILIISIAELSFALHILLCVGVFSSFFWHNLKCFKQTPILNSNTLDV